MNAVNSTSADIISPITDTERARFHELRDRSDKGETLTPAEVAEVAAYTQHLIDAEAVILTPATERLRRENEATATRIQALHTLVAHEERFVARLQQTLQELHREREFITNERKRLLAGVA